MKPTAALLLSDKRSGSTMLQRELCRHPDIRTLDYSPHTYLESHHWLKAAVLLGLPPESFSGGQVYPGYGSRANARTYILDCIRGNVPDFEAPHDDRELVFAGWEALCERFARPVFFEKSPQVLGQWAALSLLLEWIRTTSYQVRIIGLVRNPMAVQYSAYERFHTPPGRRQFAWLETHRNLLAFAGLLPEGLYRQVRYEDLVVNPRDGFADLCDFIGVPPCAEMGQDAHPESLAKWRDDPHFDFQLDETVSQMARELGYAADDLANPAKPAIPAAVRIAKKMTGTFKLARARFRDRLVKPLRLRLRPGPGKDQHDG